MDRAAQRRAGAGRNRRDDQIRLSGTIPDPDVAAFQVPPDQFGIQVPEFLLGQRQAHCLGYAVHIWTNGDQDETAAAYQRFYDSGADGVMTSRPSHLRTWLERPGHHRARSAATPQRGPSSARCRPPTGPAPTPQPVPKAKKKCKKAKKKREEVGEDAKKHKKNKCKKHKKGKKK